MSITTKTGDRGKTRLFSGEEVAKDSFRIELLGEIDELVSALGVARAAAGESDIGRALLGYQKKLFLVASEVATASDARHRLSKQIEKEDVRELEFTIHKYETEYSMPDGFIIPGSDPVSAAVDLARSITRRCERKLVKLFAEGGIENEHLLVWMNRLSDVLWLTARDVEPVATMQRDV